ncbi:ATP-binding cassette domain-containing protein [Candidatus Shapirobacteria bacterium]|nr:ATP-binding cassette domain-containing protein [Candidatus Shapirobacteria bacterium]
MNVLFKDVSKHFGSIKALENLNFEVKTGDFVFIVGSSGAGKSTLLKMILSQYRPSTGEIYIDGHLLNFKNKHLIDKLRQNIGVIFQDYQLIADKTVEENIALALDINGFPSREIPQRVDKAIDQVFLQSRRHLFPAQLSGGELQRAALARALAIDPKLILADEPTGNLDPENSWNLIKLLKEINESRGTTIIMTTHNFDIVESLNKRKITMKNGTIVNDTIKKVVKKLKKKKIKK